MRFPAVIMGIPSTCGPAVTSMSERRFRQVSVLLVGGALVVLLGAALLWYVPLRVGNLDCGVAAGSHPGVVWHRVAEPLSPKEVRENAACDAAGAPLWSTGLAGLGAGGVSVAVALSVVVATGVRARRSVRS